MTVHITGTFLMRKNQLFFKNAVYCDAKYLNIRFCYSGDMVLVTKL